MTTETLTDDATETDDSDHDFCASCSEWLKVADTDDDGCCPACHAEAVAEAAAEAKQELIDDAQGELEEHESDLEGLLEELRDVQERLAECRKSIRAARAKVAKLSK